ncbi:hypothetical protein [Micromonospora sp. SH-82]|uniref:hypothetical protein n=1 Tax=Micromonospora sp. SH-82 TaxID=3132938 RepID=UPI003EBD7C8A
MTHPAEVTSVWDWQRFEAALGGLRTGVNTLDDYVTDIHEARDDWRDDEQEKHRWKGTDQTVRRDNELDWASDRYLDGDHTRDVDD